MSADDDETLDEVREAAGAVVASLKQFIEAAERVVQDPDTFARAVDGGRSAVEAFVSGFMAQVTPDDAEDGGAAASPSTAERDGDEEIGPES